jgi:hypothetical protein
VQPSAGGQKGQRYLKGVPREAEGAVGDDDDGRPAGVNAGASAAHDGSAPEGEQAGNHAQPQASEPDPGGGKDMERPQPLEDQPRGKTRRKYVRRQAMTFAESPAWFSLPIPFTNTTKRTRGEAATGNVTSKFGWTNYTSLISR